MTTKQNVLLAGVIPVSEDKKGQHLPLHQCLSHFSTSNGNYKI